MRVFNASEVTFELKVEECDLEIEGNVMASGDDAADRKAEGWVRKELSRGNVWAWASILVTAKWAGFEGWASLGGVSCSKPEDFTDDGFDSMVDEAVNHLIENIKNEGWEVDAPEDAIEAAVSRGIAEMNAEAEAA